MSKAIDNITFMGNQKEIKILVDLCRCALDSSFTISRKSSESFESSVDWGRLIKLAIKNRVAQLLYLGITQSGFSAYVPQEKFANLKILVLRRTINNLDKTRELVQV